MKVYKDFSLPIPIGTFFMYDERGEETLPGYFFRIIHIYPKNKRISKTSGLIVLEHMYSGQYFGRSYSPSSDEARCLQVTCSNCIIQLAKNHFVNMPLARRVYSRYTSMPLQKFFFLFFLLLSYPTKARWKALPQSPRRD